MDNNDHVLLVEGQHDEHMVSHLWCSHNGYKGKLPFEIKDKKGYSSLLETIKSEVNAPDRKALGIIIDANDSLNARWDTVASSLKEANKNIDVPDQPTPNGTIIPGTVRSPRIGIWLMPNNTSPGELEDFVVEMIFPDDPVWPRSKSYIEGIPDQDRKFKKMLRAKVHAWLAARKKPGQMGLAIRHKDLDTTGPLCTTFADWLRELFESPP